MSGYTQIRIPDIKHWIPEQVLAVYDLCQMISATLMARYENELIDKMIELDNRREVDRPVHDNYDDNLQLPFDELL